MTKASQISKIHPHCALSLEVAGGIDSPIEVENKGKRGQREKVESEPRKEALHPAGSHSRPHWNEPFPQLLDLP